MKFKNTQTALQYLVNGFATRPGYTTAMALMAFNDIKAALQEVELLQTKVAELTLENEQLQITKPKPRHKNQQNANE